MHPRLSFRSALRILSQTDLRRLDRQRNSEADNQSQAGMHADSSDDVRLWKVTNETGIVLGFQQDNVGRTLVCGSAAGQSPAPPTKSVKTRDEPNPAAAAAVTLPSLWLGCGATNSLATRSGPLSASNFQPHRPRRHPALERATDLGHPPAQPPPGSTPMDIPPLDLAMKTRTAQVLERCVACGACAEVCPMPAPAGIDASNPARLTEGILTILRGGEHADAARWAAVCSGSGHCIPQCQHGVDPRFMLTMARLELASRNPDNARRKIGFAGFGAMTSGVRVLSRLQLPPDLLPASGRRTSPTDRPRSCSTPAAT
jgi:ferredoxin